VVEEEGRSGDQEWLVARSLHEMSPGDRVGA